jgi:hypothetical protein
MTKNLESMSVIVKCGKYFTQLDFYFFLPDPKFGCQPAVTPFWLGAAAMVLIFSFFGFLDSRLLLAMTSPFVWITHIAS